MRDEMQKADRRLLFDDMHHPSCGDDMPNLRLGYEKTSSIDEVFCGAPWEIRTLDLPVRSRALYPLS